MAEVVNQNQQATTQQLSTPTQSNTVPQIHTPRWLIILLLFFFPPGAWYFMWKIRAYHAWFPYLLWLYGGVILLLSSLQLFVVIPKLSALYTEIKAAQNNVAFAQNLFIALIVFAVAQIVFSFYLKGRIKSSTEPPWKLMWVTIAIFIIDYLPLAMAPSIGVLSAILPIYNLTSSF